MKRFGRDGRAISTVMANLLLVMLVVSLGASVTVWASNNFEMYRDESTYQTKTKIDSAKERFTVEEAWFVDGDDDDIYEEVYLYIRNVGEIEVDIVAVYVGGIRETSILPPLPSKIAPGYVNSISITFTNPISSGDEVSIIIVTERGNTGQSYWGPGVITD